MTDRCSRLLLSIGVVGLLGGIACGSRDEVRSERRDEVAARAPSNEVVSKPAVSSVPRVVILGDSLTAGFGLDVDEAYPALLERRIQAQGLRFEIVNAGVSGDTSAGGLSRLDWALDGDVRVLVVALGGNDALRALPAEELKRNLAQIIERAQAKGITVVVAGMEAPPNFGPEYTAAFHAVYPALARRYRVALVPFLLAGVAGDDRLNQRDRIHPNIQGAQIVADNVWAVLGPTLQRLTPRD
jgi:acyl-CoA thioesterase-1